MRRTSFFLETTSMAGLKALKARDGIPEGEAIRRAIAGYLRGQGILLPTAHRPRPWSESRAN
jgi:hypothetical protein